MWCCFFQWKCRSFHVTTHHFQGRARVGLDGADISIVPSVHVSFGQPIVAIFMPVGQVQEGEVNTSDLADPMIQAIMTSRRKKRANAKNFRKWRRRPLAKQLFGAGFSTHCLRLGCVFVERCNYYPSHLRGKWNSEYGRKIMRKVYLKRLCPCPLVKIYIWVEVMTICTVKLLFSTIGQTRKHEIGPYNRLFIYQNIVIEEKF